MNKIYISVLSTPARPNGKFGCRFNGVLKFGIRFYYGHELFVVDLNFTPQLVGIKSYLPIYLQFGRDSRRSLCIISFVFALMKAGLL